MLKLRKHVQARRMRHWPSRFDLPGGDRNLPFRYGDANYQMRSAPLDLTILRARSLSGDDWGNKSDGRPQGMFSHRRAPR